MQMKLAPEKLRFCNFFRRVDTYSHDELKGVLVDPHWGLVSLHHFITFTFHWTIFTLFTLLWIFHSHDSQGSIRIMIFRTRAHKDATIPLANNDCSELYDIKRRKEISREREKNKPISVEGAPSAVKGGLCRHRLACVGIWGYPNVHVLEWDRHG